LNILGLSEFWDLLPSEAISLEIDDGVTGTETVGGAQYGIQRGQPVWRGTINLGEVPTNDRDGIRSKIRHLQATNGRFFVVPDQRPMPAMNTVAATATVGAVSTGFQTFNGPESGGSYLTEERTSMEYSGFALHGLEAGDEISAGDFLSVKTLTGKYLIYEVISGGVADAAGRTDILPVTPALHKDMAAGLFVRLHRPYFLAGLSIGSVTDRGFSAMKSKGLSFGFQQVLA